MAMAPSGESRMKVMATLRKYLCARVCGPESMTLGNRQEGVAALPAGKSLAQQFNALLERIKQDTSLDEDTRTPPRTRPRRLPKVFPITRNHRVNCARIAGRAASGVVPP